MILQTNKKCQGVKGFQAVADSGHYGLLRIYHTGIDR